MKFAGLTVLAFHMKCIDSLSCNTTILMLPLTRRKESLLCPENKFVVHEGGMVANLALQ